MKFSVNFVDADLQQYAIAASLIISGICTIINCVQLPIPGTKFVLGTGVLSVLGTSFGSPRLRGRHRGDESRRRRP